jgi:hypothetical protein
MPERFRRLVIMNTDLPTGDRPLNPLFSVFKPFVEIEPDMMVGISSVPHLPTAASSPTISL